MARQRTCERCGRRDASRGTAAAIEHRHGVIGRVTGTLISGINGVNTTRVRQSRPDSGPVGANMAHTRQSRPFFQVNVLNTSQGVGFWLDSRPARVADGGTPRGGRPPRPRTGSARAPAVQGFGCGFRGLGLRFRGSWFRFQSLTLVSG